MDSESGTTSTLPTLYSIRSIGVATFLGGPLAAGVLVRRNFLNMGKPLAAMRALVLGLLAVLAILALIFLLPEPVWEKIPNALLPALYMTVVLVLVQKTQGPALQVYKEQGGPQYPLWRAVGVGLINLVVLLGFLAVMIFVVPASEAEQKYGEYLDQFSTNEGQALALYSLPESTTDAQFISFIEDTALPAWHENLILLNKMGELEGLGEDFHREIVRFREYTELRLHSYELLHGFLTNGDMALLEEMDRNNAKIEALIN